MGCDIHLHIEMKVDGRWLHYGCPSVDRNYDLFAMMADVRNYHDIKAIDTARGFPCDGVSVLTALCFEQEKCDAHDISWLGLEEIEQLSKWYEDGAEKGQFKCWNHHAVKSYLCGNCLTTLIGGIEDVRLVFWFDC